jgi:hypothetical protein
MISMSFQWLRVMCLQDERFNVVCGDAREGWEGVDGLEM